MFSSPFFILLSFVFFIFLGIPIAYSMIITGILFVCSLSGGIENLIIPFTRLQAGFSFPLLAIFFFVQLGNIMNETKISSYLIDLVRELVSPIFKNGLMGMITILSCAACGPLTGSACGTTTAVGSIMIPQIIAQSIQLQYWLIQES